MKVWQWKKTSENAKTRQIDKRMDSPLMYCQSRESAQVNIEYIDINLIWIKLVQ